MTIIDRYILRSFFKTLFLWFFCFIGIYVVFDLFTKLDGFRAAGDGVLGAIGLIGRYYSIQSLPFFEKTASLLCLTSAMITIAVIMRHNELVPILAAGISQVRVVKPIIFAVLFLTIGTTLAREFVFPIFLDDLQKDPAEYAADYRGSQINAATDYNSFLTIQGDLAVYSEGRIHSPNFALLSKSLIVHGKYLQAEEAIHTPGQDGRPAGFLMKNVVRPKEILTEPSLQVGEKQVILTPKDCSWLAPGDCFVVSDVPFAYLAANRSWREYASTWDYVRTIRDRSLDLGGDIELKIHSRVVQPFLDITLLFLGLPIILARGDRNVFKAMGIVVLVVFSFLLVQFGSQFVGKSVGMPILGAWVPLMLFAPIAVNLYRNMREN